MAGAELDVTPLVDQPRAVRSRALRAWVLAHGAAECTAVHTAALDALVSAWHGQGPVDLPGGVRIRRVSARLVTERPSAAPPSPGSP